MLAEGKEDPLWKKSLGFKLIFKIVMSNKRSRKYTGTQACKTNKQTKYVAELTEAIETDPPGSQILELLDPTCNKAMLIVSMDIKAGFKVLSKDMETLKATLQSFKRIN